MIRSHQHQHQARIAVGLNPEIFFALQALGDPEAGHDAWRERALAAFPRRDWSLDLPSGMWPAAADIVTIAPTPDFPALLAALAEVPARVLQERFLTGLFHLRRSVAALLEDGQDVAQVVALMPKAKREWLAYSGLYPVQPESPATRALARVVHDPEGFRADLAATLHGFWNATFSDTWSRLLPALEASVSERRRLFVACTFPEFLRHTLLPVECDVGKQALRALRGGYELPLADMGPCTFTPSAFNTRRIWTVHSHHRDRPWFPYLESDLGTSLANDTAQRLEPVPDVALMFRALGDATRFAIASLIGRQPRTSVELAATLSISKATVSHHVHILRSAELIEEVQYGGSVLIALNKHNFARISELAMARLFESRGPIDLARTRTEK